MSQAVLIALAVGVAFVYFTIAAFVVPKIGLPGARQRFVTIFRLGAAAFFVGCGLTHIHIAVHAITNPETVRVHEIGFHLFQFVGGWIFVLAALKFLDIQVQVKKTGQEVRIEKLEELAVRDPLTGAYNRRHFEEAIGREMARYHREGTPLSVLQVDIDDFKLINDNRGHGGGDATLTQLVALITDTVRPTDTFARFGGDEFGLILAGSDSADAVLVADRIRERVKQGPGALRGVTVSVGVASCPQDGVGSADLLICADQALYRSKHEGKDRTTASSRPKPAQSHA